MINNLISQHRSTSFLKRHNRLLFEIPKKPAAETKLFFILFTKSGLFRNNRSMAANRENRQHSKNGLSLVMHCVRSLIPIKFSNRTRFSFFYLFSLQDYPVISAIVAKATQGKFRRLDMDNSR